MLAVESGTLALDELQVPALWDICVPRGPVVLVAGAAPSFGVHIHGKCGGIVVVLLNEGVAIVVEALEKLNEKGLGDLIPVEP